MKTKILIACLGAVLVTARAADPGVTLQNVKLTGDLERTGNDFVSYLPVDGAVKFSWKRARPEAEGKLFYAAEMISQITVSPGLMRQSALVNGRLMQGQMDRVALVLHGGGEVTRVLGE